MTQDEMKLQVGLAALDYVVPGEIVGVGTGSTVNKFIDALVQIAQLDPETTELHFALGSLFRRRGETERAIRVHQHLANRDDLPSRHRDHAAYELGRDFLRAGLLDRAETSLNRVSPQSKFGIPAKESLLEMYQVEKDWAKPLWHLKS